MHYFDRTNPVKVRQTFKKNRMEYCSIIERLSSLVDSDQSFPWSFTQSKSASKTLTIFFPNKTYILTQHVIGAPNPLSKYI